jgi:hypothetical protein
VFDPLRRNTPFLPPASAVIIAVAATLVADTAKMEIIKSLVEQCRVESGAY